MPTLDPARLGAWALLTGGSSGIGFAHAKLLAARGFNIALVGRDTDKLSRAATALSAEFGVEVDTRSVDLGSPGSAERVTDWVADREVGVYVSSAGGVEPGDFTDVNMDNYLQTVRVKVDATLGITQSIANRMRARGAGAILLVSSTGALQGIPSLSVNSGLEAFVLTFSESLHHELKRSGVTVTSLLPGPTSSEGFFSKVPEGTAPPRGSMTPDATAAEGIAALARGKVTHVAGAHNRLLMGALTRKARTALMGRLIGQVFGVAPTPLTAQS